MEKGVWITALLALLLFLTACSRVPAGENPTETAAVLREVQTGTNGVELDVLPDTPPSEIYDENELFAIVEVRNRGNHNLEENACFVQIAGFDPNIITGGFNVPRSCAENIGVLEGKNVYNVEGGFNQIEFQSPNIRLPDNVFEYAPTLSYVACYNYKTRANPVVCVDPLFYQVTREQKTCIPQDVSMGSGQGAPIGVSFVGVDMVGSRAVFEIRVKNYGSGRVLSPDSDVRSCTDTSLEYTDLDKVRYTVQMAGGTPVDCRPRDGLVRLTNDQGNIVCSFNIEGTSSFETPLQIELDYNYIQSYQKPLRIIQTPE